MHCYTSVDACVDYNVDVLIDHSVPLHRRMSPKCSFGFGMFMGMVLTTVLNLVLVDIALSASLLLPQTAFLCDNTLFLNTCINYILLMLVTNITRSPEDQVKL